MNVKSWFLLNNIVEVMKTKLSNRQNHLEEYESGTGSRLLTGG